MIARPQDLKFRQIGKTNMMYSIDFGEDVPRNSQYVETGRWGRRRSTADSTPIGTVDCNIFICYKKRPEKCHQREPHYWRHHAFQ
jgi:hypothetical protein